MFKTAVLSVVKLLSTCVFSYKNGIYLYGHGGIAQLGEHLPCKQGVSGSNPLISTTFVFYRVCG